MRADAQRTGIALLCDHAGVIRQVMYADPFPPGLVRPGIRLAALVAHDDVAQVEAFLAEIKANNATFDWELEFVCLGGITAFHCSGGQVNDQILVVGTVSQSDVSVRFYEELMSINNEQANALRAALKELALQSQTEKHRHVQDSQLYDQLTRLNNELVAVQRELAKRNAEITAQRERYRTLSEMISDYAYAFRVDPAGDLECEWVTDAFTRVTGYTVDELSGCGGLDALLSPGDQAAAEARKRTLLSGESDIREFSVLTKEGVTRWVLDYRRPVWDADHGQVVRIYGAAQDVTERKEMEAQLQEYANHLEYLVETKVRELEMERAKVIQTAKLAAIGETATGVAHELNQPLAAILFEADYLSQVAEKKEHIFETLPNFWDELGATGRNLADDVARCRRIVDHLRAFGRVSEQHVGEIDLNESIEGSFILTGARLRQHTIDVQVHLAPELPAIRADVNRLEQVFINLISNAEHALEVMERRVKSGQIERPGYRKVLEISTQVDGTDVVATVRDNGCGISPEAQERIFEPFFTTKPAGEGTGLGLSISHGIVTEFGGEIVCASVENDGTTFTLRFPVATGGAS
ncbi:MAG: PAS domain S-box protein [Anaerolineae bacterium]|nr:PAS domain S-box protein [Anaerolineae bacterium]